MCRTDRTKETAQNGAELTEEQVTDVVKTKKKRNRPDLQKFGEENTVPGDNARYLRYARASLDLPPIDISDPQQVWDRINLYFDFCEKTGRKPNKIGVANWIGVCRDTLNSWKQGECRSTTHSALIKKVDGILEETLVEYMLDGKVNPPNGIFMLKNHFGYKDVQDVVVAHPSDPLGEQKTQKELEEYMDIIDAE